MSRYSVDPRSVIHEKDILIDILVVTSRKREIVRPFIESKTNCMKVPGVFHQVEVIVLHGAILLAQFEGDVVLRRFI